MILHLSLISRRSIDWHLWGIVLVAVVCVTIGRTEAYDENSNSPGAVVQTFETTARAQPTPVLPAVEAAPLLIPIPSVDAGGAGTSPAPLSNLQQRKQDRMNDLQRKAEQVVRSWNQRRARQALAALREQRLKEELARQKAIAQQNVERSTRMTESGTNLQSQTNEPSRNSDTPSKSKQSTTSKVPVPTPGPVPDVPVAESEVVVPTDTRNPTDASKSPGQGMVNAIDGPIDRLALATSLFAVGKLRQCLHTIDAIDHATLSRENSDWCRYMAACCYRKLGEYGEAESRYRELISTTEAAWLADGARWWLDHINDQKELESDLESLKVTLKSWKEEIDVLRTAN